MKRPLALVGFSYLLALAAAVYFGARWSLVLACAALLGFLIAMLLPRARATGVFPAALLAVSLALGSFAAFSRSAVEPVRALAGKDAVIEGTVCDLPYQAYGRTYYIVEVRRTAGTTPAQSFKIRLSCQKALHAEPYSNLRVKVHFFLPDGGEGYSSRSYYASRGILLFAYLYEYEGVTVSTPSGKPLYDYALRLRSALMRSVRALLPPEQANLVNGVLLGDRTGLSDEVTSDFRTAGISHLLSVSGLHMATMAELILMLLLSLKIPKKPAALIASFGVFAFMAVTCFVPSVTRSGVMCLLYLSGILFSRRPDPLNSLGAAVLLIGLFNPYAAADVGLLLSFSATLGLILCAGPIARYLNRKLDRWAPLGPLVRGANGILGTTAGAVLFTLPIVILSFGAVSLIAPVSNLLELIPSTLMMNFAAVAAVLNLIAPQSFLAMPFALAAGLLAKFMQSCAHFLAGIPYAGAPASGGFVLIWLAGSFLLGAAALFLSRSKRVYQAAAWLSVIVLLAGVFSGSLASRGVTRIAVLDVGSAEAVAITRDGHGAVIGCGGLSAGTIRRYLQQSEVTRLDYLQPLTGETQESVNCANLLEAFLPRRLVLRDTGLTDSFLQASAGRAGSCAVYRSDAQACVFQDVQIDTVAQGEASAVRVEAGQTSVLICPKGTDLAGLPSEWLDSDFAVLDEIPEEADLLGPACTILSMDSGELPGRTAVKTANPVATAGAGNIVLQIGRDNSLQIRRETDA